MHIKRRIEQLEQSADRKTGIRVIVAYRQGGESEYEAIERYKQNWRESQQKGFAVFLSETDLKL